MNFQPITHSGAYRQFVALSNKLQRLLSSGEFHLLTAEKRQQLVDRLRALYCRLAGIFSQGRLRRILASASVVLGLGLPAAQAQPFSGPQESPFGIAVGSNFVFPQLVDIDNDGDLDILGRSYNYESGEVSLSLAFFENTGSSTAPAFAPPQFNNFLPAGLGGYTTTIFLADIDGDGDLDLFAGTYNDPADTGVVRYYENTGTPSSPVFAAPQTNPFGLQQGNYFIAPGFVDLDDDGDLDFLATDLDPVSEVSRFHFQENTGTAESPAFGPIQNNPFNLQSTPEIYTLLPTIGDLDGDGDYDLILGGDGYLQEGDTYRTYVQYVENTGSPSAPTFGSPVNEPFGIEFPVNSFLAAPALADIDDDGDLDLFVSGYIYNETGKDGLAFWYFENTRAVNAVPETEKESDFQLFPTLVQDQLHWRLKATEAPERLWMEAYAADGRLAERWQISGLQGSLPVQNWPAGMYAVRLLDASGRSLGVQRVFRQ
ncbi:MAG: VCBS repeat-containing protein [Phaeodactylibacter sp.]|nr:VCBS repeat-containing protein [Phaeodactylibacter sp.]HQU59602.1 FG-GAP-like repeat-containing protein [Saprospiraceae bacterium]